MGKVTGDLSWSRESQKGGHKVVHKSELKEMLLTAADGARLTAPLNGGHFVFTGVPAGRTYLLSPAGRFRSEPRSRRIDCRRNVTFQREDFTIVGGPF